jgi:hypothetical protein
LPFTGLVLLDNVNNQTGDSRCGRGITPSRQIERNLR